MRLLQLHLFLSCLVLSLGSNTDSPNNHVRRSNARILEDTIQVVFAFEYNLYFIGDNYSSNTASMTVDDAISLALHDALRGYSSVNVTLDSLSTSSSVECSNATLAKHPSFDSCVQANSNLVLGVESAITSDVAQRAIIQLVLAFVSDFNEEHNDLFVSFEYPVQVEATVEVEMLGVDGIIESKSDVLLFQDTFKSTLESTLLKADVPTFNVTGAYVMYQVSGVYNQSDLGRQLQTAGDEYNRITVFVRATCKGTDNCTHDSLQQYLNEEGPTFSNDIQVALRNAGPKQGSVYFSGLTDIYIVGESYVNRTGEKIPNTTLTIHTEMAQDKNPPWLWVLIVVNLVILISFCAFVASRTASHERMKQAAI